MPGDFPVEIRSPAAIVWMLLTEPAHQDKWIPGLVSAENAGESWIWHWRMGRRRHEYRGFVTAWEPNRLVAVTIGQGALPRSWQVRVLVELHERKQTTLVKTTIRLEAASFSVARFLLAPLVQYVAAWTMQRWFRVLRHLAEEAACVA